MANAGGAKAVRNGASAPQRISADSKVRTPSPRRASAGRRRPRLRVLTECPITTSRPARCPPPPSAGGYQCDSQPFPRPARLASLALFSRGCALEPAAPVAGASGRLAIGCSTRRRPKYSLGLCAPPSRTPEGSPRRAPGKRARDLCGHVYRRDAVHTVRAGPGAMRDARRRERADAVPLLSPSRRDPKSASYGPRSPRCARAPWPQKRPP